MGGRFTAAEVKEIVSIVGSILKKVAGTEYPYSRKAFINALRGISEGEFGEFVDVYCGTSHDQHPIPIGWKVAVIDGVIQDIPASDFDIPSMDLSKYFSRLQDGRGHCPFRQMCDTAIRTGIGFLGVADGVRLMAEQKAIPYVLGEHHIFLLGTILEDSNGDLWYRCLYRHGDGDKAVWFWGAFPIEDKKL